MSEIPNGPRVLLVDDDDTFRRLMSAELSRRGYSITSAASGAEAVDAAITSGPDVVLLDMRLPDMTGIEVLEKICDLELRAGVIMLTGHGTIDTAIQATRLGAYDYLEKPCPVEKIEIALEKAYEHVQLLARKRVLQDGFSPPDARLRMVGRSPAFERLQESMARIARTSETTLVLGETGVGKELVAAFLHTQGPRAEAPYVVVDCAALHEELLLSELFGHERGAFTGADRQKHGLFEVADGGTIFLDEIGEMSPEIQAKLLRVLETGRFRRVGGTKEVAVDVRVISATNRDLASSVTHKRFREDLFFRLSTLTIEVPALRERKADIPLLIDHFTARFNKRLELSCRFSQEALQVLAAHDWPGNVRELIHVVEQALVLAEGHVIGMNELPVSLRGGVHVTRADSEGGMLPLHEVEKRHLLSVLESVQGNRASAARILEISERNLYRLLKKYASSQETSDDQADASRPT